MEPGQANLLSAFGGGERIERQGTTAEQLALAMSDLEMMLVIQELTPAHKTQERQENRRLIEHYLIEVLELEAGTTAEKQIEVINQAAETAWLQADFRLAG